jgi:hypothetical protein
MRQKEKQGARENCATRSIIVGYLQEILEAIQSRRIS